MEWQAADNSNCVFLWLVDGRSIRAEDWNLLQRLLPESERQRISEYSCEKLQMQRGLTEVTLRYALSSISQVPFFEWKFLRDKLGKPSIIHPDDKKIQFNVSHSSGFVAVSIRQSGLIGVDLEPYQRAKDLIELSADFLSVRELKEIQNASKEIQQKSLLQRWTLKEALSKAVGLGFHLPFQNIDIEICDSENEISLRENHELLGQNEWDLRSLLLAKESVLLSLAVQKISSQPLNLSIFEISYQEIIRNCMGNSIAA